MFLQRSRNRQAELLAHEKQKDCPEVPSTSDPDIVLDLASQVADT
jgi:hypothetical protein